MKKKLLALLTALMLFAVPMLSVNAENVSQTQAAGPTLEQVTFQTDVDGMTAATDPTYGPSYAELLDKLTLDSWTAEDYRYYDLKVGDASLLTVGLLNDNGVYYFASNLLDQPIKADFGSVLSGGLTGGMSQEQMTALLEKLGSSVSSLMSLGGLLKDGTTVLDLANDLSGIQLSYTNTVMAVFGLYSYMDTSVEGDWSYVTFNVPVSALTAVVDGVAADLLATEGLTDVMNKYLASGDFETLVNSLKDTANNAIADFIQSDVRLAYGMNSDGTATGYTAGATLGSGTGSMNVLASVSVSGSDFSAALTMTNDNGEGMEYAGSYMGGALDLSVSLNTLQDGVMTKYVAMGLSYAPGTCSMVLNNEDVFNLKWNTDNGLTVTGNVQGKPVVFSLVTDNQGLPMVTVGYDTVLATVSVSEISDNAATFSCDLNGSHLLDVTVNHMENAEGMPDQAAVFGDLANAMDVTDAASDSGKAALQEQMQNNLVVVLNNVLPEMPAGLLTTTTTTAE